MRISSGRRFHIFGRAELVEMINSRNKGKAFEQRIARIWVSLFGGVVERSSYVSKKRDDAGVDLIGTEPFNVQCKAVEQSMDIHLILERMPVETNINIVLHKRNNRGTIAAMDCEDFFSILKELQELKEQNNDISKRLCACK